MTLILLQIIFALLFLFSFAGGIRNLFKGPAILQREGDRISSILDNAFRFMAGVYLGLSIICLWMAITMNNQELLVYLVALTVFLAGFGRIVSINFRGVSRRRFYRYAAGEIALSVMITFLQFNRS